MFRGYTVEELRAAISNTRNFITPQNPNLTVQDYIQMLAPKLDNIHDLCISLLVLSQDGFHGQPSNKEKVSRDESASDQWLLLSKLPLWQLIKTNEQYDEVKMQLDNKDHLDEVMFFNRNLSTAAFFYAVEKFHLLDRIQRSHSSICKSTFRHAIARELSLEDLCKFVCQFGQNETLKLVAFLEDDKFQGLRKVCNTSNSLLPFNETVKKELEHYPEHAKFLIDLYALRNQSTMHWSLPWLVSTVKPVTPSQEGDRYVSPRP